MSTRSAIIVPAALIIFALGCSSDSTAPASAPIAFIGITPTAVVLQVGATRQMTAIIRDSAGNTLANRAVKWVSDNPDVATISASGLVTAVSPGYADILATSEGKTTGVGLTVPTPEPPPVTFIGITPSAIVLNIGATRQMAAVLRDSTGKSITDRSVTWQSDNPAVATISASGLVTAISSGYADILATIDGKTTGVGLTVATP